MRPHWGKVDPSSNMSGVLITRMPCEETDIHERAPCEDWNYVVSS